MIRLTNSIEIERPVEEVFAYVSDVTNDPAWHTDILDARRIDSGPIGIGSEFEVRIQPFMGQSTGRVAVTVHQPSAGFELSGRLGPMEPVIRYRFRRANGETEVEREVSMQPPGLMRLLAPVLRPMMRGRNQGFLANLKRVMEGQSGNPQR